MMKVMSRSTSSRPPSAPQPAWDIARLFPDQGAWSEDDYLALDTNHLVEFTDGHVEVLPMPKTSHQRMVQYLSNQLQAFASARNLGTTLFAPLRVRLRKNKYREPDVVFMLAAHADRIGEDYWDGADLVMEVVSADPESRERDLGPKRKDYAAAGIPEYWIVDPQERTIVVLKLAGKAYDVHGEYADGARAESASLAGFGVSVSDVLQFAR
jgi:Uma2 family endonuclease